MEPQAAACARMIAAIIAQALRDCAIKPSKQEVTGEINIDQDARSAVRWVFGRSPNFMVYCQAIGISGDQLVAALKEPGQHIEDSFARRNSLLTNGQRRVIRLRERWESRRLS